MGFLFVFPYSTGISLFIFQLNLSREIFFSYSEAIQINCRSYDISIYQHLSSAKRNEKELLCVDAWYLKKILSFKTNFFVLFPLLKENYIVPP